MFTSDNDADIFRRGDRLGSLQRYAQQRMAAAQGTKLFWYRNTRFSHCQAMQSAAVPRRQHDRPRIPGMVHSLATSTGVGELRLLFVIATANSLRAGRGSKDFVWVMAPPGSCMNVGTH